MIRPELKRGLKKEWQQLLIAIQFYSRIPVRLELAPEEKKLESASRYVPLVGALVAGISAVFYYLSEPYIGNTNAAILAVGAGVLTTGALHEDGLADSADGFGGGWDGVEILSIMKDSRLGTYGSCALIMALSLKIGLLSVLNSSSVLIALLVVHMLSRATAVSLIHTMDYVQLDGQSKVKTFAKHLSSTDLRIAVALSLMPLMLLPYAAVIASLSAAIVIRQVCQYYFKKRLLGYTGDCLGACEQCCELAILVALAVSL